MMLGLLVSAFAALIAALGNENKISLVSDVINKDVRSDVLRCDVMCRARCEISGGLYKLYRRLSLRQRQRYYKRHITILQSRWKQ